MSKRIVSLFTNKKVCFLNYIVIVFFALCSTAISVLAAEDSFQYKEYSDKRVNSGEYTATLAEMAANRLYVYGFIDDPSMLNENDKSPILPMDVSKIPSRLDAALLLYRIFGIKPLTDCPYQDVPNEYKEAVAWMHNKGYTQNSIKDGYGIGNITEKQFITMVSRILRWKTENTNATTIEEYANEKGLYAAQKIGNDFTFGEMYQIVCNVMDYGFSEKCIPIREKPMTPKNIEIIATNLDSATLQLKMALKYLPKTITVTFESCKDTEADDFFCSFFGECGSSSALIAEWTDHYRVCSSYYVTKTQKNTVRITINNYSEAALAFACASNYLKVFQDNDFEKKLLEFYQIHIVPYKKLTKEMQIKKCHDEICRLAVYDTVECHDGVIYWIHPKAHRIVGFMERNSIVCESYSHLYSWMLMHLGIENYVVLGRLQSTAHTWNVIKYNDVWYNVDITMNDQTNSDFRMMTNNEAKEDNYLF